MNVNRLRPVIVKQLKNARDTTTSLFIAELVGDCIQELVKVDPA
jgi:hypothetical protein